MVLAHHLYRRMMRRGRLLALLALAASPGLVLWLAGFDATPEQVDAHYSEILATVGFAFAIAAVIITSSTLREERDAGTLPYIYMRPVSRLSLAASSLLAGLAAALTVALGGWAATYLAALATGADLGVALAGAVLFTTAAVGYATVFVPLGYILPRSLLVGLGYVIVIESILAAAVTGLAQFSLWRIALSIYADLVPSFGGEAAEVLGPVTPGMGGGLIKLAAVGVAGLGLLTWALRKRDAL
jgi:ABC-type transport system involved in multi-copper enzyme maturation permease subunit